MIKDNDIFCPASVENMTHLERLRTALATNTETVTLTLSADEARFVCDALIASKHAKPLANVGGRATARKSRRQNRR